jgi:hypothetical protein
MAYSLLASPWPRRDYDGHVTFDISGLPGHDLVEEGVADLAAGKETQLAMLVAMAQPRLQALGVDVPTNEHLNGPDGPEPSHKLYELLSADGPGAHSRYNALVRRMVSFARAAEHAAAR